MKFKINRHDLRIIRMKATQCDPDGELSTTYYEEQLKGQDYVAYAHNVDAPLPNLEPGAIVACDCDGMSAKWLNGTVYIRRVILEQKQNQTK